MKWNQTLIKMLKAAAVAAVCLFAVTLGEEMLSFLKARPEAWATAAIAVVTVFLDWVKHRNDPVRAT